MGTYCVDKVEGTVTLDNPESTSTPEPETRVALGKMTKGCSATTSMTPEPETHVALGQHITHHTSLPWFQSGAPQPIFSIMIILCLNGCS